MPSCIRHRSGTKYENFIFINSKTGKIRKSTNFEKVNTATPAKGMRKMVNGADDNTIITIHNHPGSAVPSWDDILVAKQRKYKYGLIACHDETIFKYRITGNIIFQQLQSLIEKAIMKVT